jgi:hypothetical protein
MDQKGLIVQLRVGGGEMEKAHSGAALSSCLKPASPAQQKKL